MTARTVQKLPIAALGGALLLAGCGVKGPLEPPVGAENRSSPNPLSTTITSDAPGSSVTSTQTQTSSSNSKAFSSPIGNKQDEGKKKRLRQGGVPVTSESEKPDQPFILDKLL